MLNIGPSKQDTNWVDGGDTREVEYPSPVEGAPRSHYLLPGKTAEVARGEMEGGNKARSSAVVQGRCPAPGSVESG